MADLSAVGATHRTEADKAKHRTFAFAVVLVLAHLLDLRPSEAEALGLKVTVNDPAIIYGAIALLFGYQFSRFISESNKSEAYLPLNLQAERRHMRSCVRVARRSYQMGRKKRGIPQTPQDLKKSARRFLMLDNLVLLPYRLIAILFVLAATVFMFMDLYSLAVLIWMKSPVVSEITHFITTP